jgi:hypothetical protein
VAVSPPPEPAYRRRGHKRWPAFVGAVVIVLVVGVVAPTWIGGRAPLLHWSCERGSEATEATIQVPSLLLNSPFGGHAWGNVTYPIGTLPYGVTSLGTQAANGSADWAGFESGLGVYLDQDAIVLGPGENNRCTQPYQASLVPTANTSLGIQVLGSGNFSDRAEPSTLFPGTNTGYDNLSFENGFQNDSAATISTCGSSSASLWVTSHYLTLWYRFNTGQGNATVSFTAPSPVPVSTIGSPLTSECGKSTISPLPGDLAVAGHSLTLHVHERPTRDRLARGLATNYS